jgi:predicted DNA-binding transcriptional regulator YafY
MTPLRKRMLDAMILRGFAQHTQETYLGAVIRLSQHYNCSPDRLSDEQVQAYLLYLLQTRHRSRSTVNLTSCAVRFLICDVLGQTERRLQIPLGRSPQRLTSRPKAVPSVATVARWKSPATTPWPLPAR